MIGITDVAHLIIVDFEYARSADVKKQNLDHARWEFKMDDGAEVP